MSITLGKKCPVISGVEEFQVSITTPQGQANPPTILIAESPLIRNPDFSGKVWKMWTTWSGPANAWSACLDNLRGPFWDGTCFADGFVPGSCRGLFGTGQHQYDRYCAGEGDCRVCSSNAPFKVRLRVNPFDPSVIPEQLPAGVTIVMHGEFGFDLPP